LIGKPIGELIQTLSEASQTRINCPVNLVIDDKGNPPEDVTVVFYRIAQEAFSNIIKYAEASEVSINLACDKDAVMMIVKDNGRGFEPDQVPPGHIGLNIMAERIEQIGGELTIDSKPGQGTQITAKWSKPSEDKNHA
jgi:signal transduction histidine kinase